MCVEGLRAKPELKRNIQWSFLFIIILRGISQLELLKKVTSSHGSTN